MKYAVFLFLISITFPLKAQLKDEIKKCELDSINGMVIHTIAEIQPEYEGGIQKFYKDLSSNVMLKDGDFGCVKVVISFVIDTDGNIRNLCPTDNVEITSELINSINNWTPGKIDGTNVPVRMYLSMNIKLG